MGSSTRPTRRAGIVAAAGTVLMLALGSGQGTAAGAQGGTGTG
jgi:hypothetical protein